MTFSKRRIADDAGVVSFDHVFYAQTLEHVAFPSHSLRQLLGLVRPGGELVVTVPDGRSDTASAYGLNRTGASYVGHVSFWSIGSWALFLQEHCPGSRWRSASDGYSGPVSASLERRRMTVERAVPAIPTVTAAAECTFFFPDGWLGVSPTVLTLVELLAARGYAVTVYAFANPLPKPSSLPPGVRVAYFWRPSDSRLLAPVLRAMRRLGLNPVIILLDAVVYIGRSLFDSAVRQGRARRGSTVGVGVDGIGALAAAANRRFSGTPYVWLSLELQGQEGRAAWSLGRKVFARVLHRAAAFLIQDEARLRTACRLYGLEHPRVIFLPNGPSGSAEVAAGVQDINFFRERFGLSARDYPHILLHAGAITEDFFAVEIARGLASLERCALVFHERTKRSEDEPLLLEMRAVNTRNLFLSLTPVPYDQLDRLYAAATIGLAFYRPFNDDISEIAMASGKLAFYLKHGKPVLMNDLPSFRRLLGEYPFGLTIADPADPQEVESAVSQLLDNYDAYSEQARRCFTELFDMSRTAEPVLQLLDSLSGRMDVVLPVGATAAREGSEA